MSAASAPSAPTTVAAAEAKEPVLQFAAGKSLPYRRRLAWTAGLVAAGFVVQVAFMDVLWGLPFLVAALVLGWVKGFDTRLDRRAYSADATWERVPFERVEEVLRLDREMTRWDASALDITSGAGVILWVLLSGAILGASFWATQAFDEAAGWIVGVDGALLLLVQWFSGMRTVDRRADLVLRASTLADVVARGLERIQEVGEVGAQMQMQGTGKDRVPVDVRMTISNPKAGPHFLGVQGQVVLNRVQGTPYPYFYAVVVSRPGKGLLAAAEQALPAPNVLVEAKRQGDVEIAVVRQETSKTSGYHTDPAAALRVLSTALDLTKAWLG